MTASNFGKVVKRRVTTSPLNLVKSLVSKRTFSTPAMDYGKINESVARQHLENMYDITVEDAGLFIDEDYGFLGASPDGKILYFSITIILTIVLTGLVGDDALVEIKCFHSLHKKNLSIHEAIARKINICLEIVDGQPKLKRKHNYYYQVCFTFVF